MSIQDILQTIGVLIAIVISGKLAIDQWKARLMQKAFQNGAKQGVNQLLSTIINTANQGEAFPVELNGQRIFLAKVAGKGKKESLGIKNKKKGKK